MDKFLNVGWIVDEYGWFKCICRLAWSIEEDALAHTNSGVDGFMKCGLQYIAEQHHNCICGKQNMNRYMSHTHVCDNGYRCLARVERNKEWFCKLCNIQFSSDAKLKRHMNTTKHDKIENNIQSTQLHCDICNVSFESKNRLDNHLKTRKHTKKVEGVRPLSLHCEVCSIHCSSEPAMKTHLTSKKHIKNSTGIDPNYCKACDLHCKGKKQIEAHIATAKHIRNTQSAVEAVK